MSRQVLLVVSAVIEFVGSGALAIAAHAQGPRVFLLDGAQLKTARDQISQGDAQLKPALDELRRDADRALDDGPYSVINKQISPPSGDRHDYMSLAPYWWPNPN